MGVLVVRKEVKRQTSLMLGISLALVLGAAAAFFIFALPQQLLESLTTTVGLSRIMVQAEPPISPNDRVLLAALAGLGTVGLGWVLVDWLLFGRVGMSAIIRPREDDYEDEGDDYRPSNPLDLVVPDLRPLTLSVPVPAAPDLRKPLSARTDIGDPPASMLGAGSGGGSLGTYDIALDQLLPPLDQLFPGGPPPSPAASAEKPMPAPAPVIPPIMDIADLTPPPEAPVRAAPPQPLILPSAAELAAPPSPAVSPSFELRMPMPPVPEQRPVVLPDPEPASPVRNWPDQFPAFPASVIPPLVASPVPPPAPAPISTPPAGRDVTNDIFGSYPSTLPDLPPAGLPLGMPTPTNERMAWPPVEPVPQPAAPPPASFTPPPPPPMAPPPVERVPVPGHPVAVHIPVDRAPLEDLLARLEYGMLKRRPATPVPVETNAFRPAELPIPPVEPIRRPLPAYAAAPARMADVPPPVVPAPPPLQPAPAVHVPAPEIAMVPVPQAAPLMAPEGGDGLLDQPLHVALDVLRGRVRRLG